LHQHIGEREEQAYEQRTRKIVAELAVHFEQGRDYRKAVDYLQQAGENVVRRSAYQEAISLLSKALALLKLLPDTLECAQQELMLQVTFGPALISIKGFTAPEVECIYAAPMRSVNKAAALGSLLRRWRASGASISCAGK
jgi:adenylate cyclase